MTKYKFYIKSSCLIIGLFFQFTTAQINDLVKLDYSNLSSEDSKFTFSRTRLALNYPFKLNEKDYLISGVNYSRIDADINIEGLSDNFTSDKTEFRQYELNVAYIHTVNKNKKFIVQFTPGLSSNFTQKKILNKDIVFTVGAGILIDKRKEAIDKPYRLILGATFSGTSGVSFPLPFVSYYRKLSEHWEYNLGIPKTNYKYTFQNGKSKLIFLTRLEGFNSHIQDDVTYKGEAVNRLRSTLIVGGLGYEHYFTKHILFYSVFDNVLVDRVRLNQGNEEVKKININKAYLFKIGIKFQI